MAERVVAAIVHKPRTIADHFWEELASENSHDVFLFDGNMPELTSAGSKTNCRCG